MLLHSNRRTDGVLLDAMIADNPDSDLIPKVVNGLLAHRTRDAGTTPRKTSSSCWRWTATSTPSRPSRPDFVARIWLGDDYVGRAYL